jgi:hypothetical protein
MPPKLWRRSLQKKKVTDGKAEPFRTAGRQSRCPLSVVHRAAKPLSIIYSTVDYLFQIAPILFDVALATVTQNGYHHRSAR